MRRMIGLAGAAALLLIGTADVASAGWNTWNGCPPDWTVQDGVCKPYRGPHGPTYYPRYGYYPNYEYGYQPRYYGYRQYEPDPGAAVALGILGGVGSIRAHQGYTHRRHYRHHRRHH